MKKPLIILLAIAIVIVNLGPAPVKAADHLQASSKCGEWTVRDKVGKPDNRLEIELTEQLDDKCQGIFLLKNTTDLGLLGGGYSMEYTLAPTNANAGTSIIRAGAPGLSMLSPLFPTRVISYPIDSRSPGFIWVRAGMSKDTYKNDLGWFFVLSLLDVLGIPAFANTGECGIPLELLANIVMETTDSLEIFSSLLGNGQFDKAIDEIERVGENVQKNIIKELLGFTIPCVTTAVLKHAAGLTGIIVDIAWRFLTWYIPWVAAYLKLGESTSDKLMYYEPPVLAFQPTTEPPINTRTPVTTPGPPAISDPHPPITTGNVDQITELARFGKGIPTQVIWADDNDSLIVNTRAGIYMYDSHDLELLGYLGSTYASEIDVSPDGTLLAYTPEEGVLGLADSSTFEVKARFEIDISPIRSIRFMHDGSHLILGENDLWLVNYRTGKVEKKIHHNPQSWGPRSVSPDDSIFAFQWGLDMSQALYHFDTQRMDVSLNNAGIDFSPDNKYIVVGVYDSIEVYELSSLKPVSTLFTLKNSQFQIIRYSPSGNFLVAAHLGYKDIYLFDMRTQSLIQKIKSFGTMNVSISPDDTRVAAIDQYDTIRIYDIGSDEPPLVIDSHYPKGDVVTFLADNQTIIAWDEMDHRAGVLNTSDVNAFKILVGPDFGQPRDFYSEVFYADRNRAVFLRSDQKLTVWDFNSGNKQDYKPYGGAARNIALSPEGSRFYVSMGDEFETWEIQGPRFVRAQRIDGWVRVFGFSPDERLMIKTTPDQGFEIVMTDPQDTTFILGVNDYQYIYTSVLDNDRLAAILSESGIVVWDYVKRVELYRIDAPGETIFYRDISISPNSELLAGVAVNGKIYLWRASDGKLLKVLPGHGSSISSIDFSADGSLIVTGSYDGTVRLWGVNE